MLLCTGDSLASSCCVVIDLQLAQTDTLTHTRTHTHIQYNSYYCIRYSVLIWNYTAYLKFEEYISINITFMITWHVLNLIIVFFNGSYVTRLE